MKKIFLILLYQNNLKIIKIKIKIKNNHVCLGVLYQFLFKVFFILKYIKIIFFILKKLFLTSIYIYKNIKKKLI